MKLACKSISQPCAVAKKFWWATGQSNLAYKHSQPQQELLNFGFRTHTTALGPVKVFHSVCQVWLPSGPPESFTCSYCTWLRTDLLRHTIYQRKGDVDMLNTIKSMLAKSTYSLRHSAYPHHPYIDTSYILPPCRHRLKLVLTGTSIPLWLIENLVTDILLGSMWSKDQFSQHHKYSFMEIWQNWTHSFLNSTNAVDTLVFPVGMKVRRGNRVLAERTVQCQIPVARRKQITVVWGYILLMSMIRWILHCF